MKGQDNPLIPNPHPHLLNSTIKKPIIVPSSYQPKKTHKPRKAIRTTEISQSSGPINLVADETVYKEWEDRMERAATTASSLDAEQDSGSGPRCQDTILGGADAQTRFETASKQSNDPPLSRGYTLGSGEDSMKLLELMELCTKFQVHYALTVNPTIYTSCIEQFWTTAKAKTVNGERQLQVLVNKKKVIITETIIRSDLHLEDASGIDCLPTATIFEELARMGRKQKKTTAVPHPSDSTADVPNKESMPIHSNDPLLSGEDRLKLTDLMDMCTNCLEISKFDAEMFDTDALIGNEVFAKNDMIEKDQDVIPKEVSIAAPSTTVVSPPVITEVEITLAQTLANLKSEKYKVMMEPVQSTATTALSTIPKAKGITFRDASESTTRTPTSVSSLSIKDKGKLKYQAELMQKERLARKKERKANIALIDLSSSSSSSLLLLRESSIKAMSSILRLPFSLMLREDIMLLVVLVVLSLASLKSNAFKLWEL
ncbi:hypothetical protein Tco_0000455 [Tanacetum coccineum]